MPWTSESGGKGKGKVVWNRELKICLHLLWTEHELTGKVKADVVNIVFKEYLTGCGVDAVSVNIIASQWHEHKKPSARDWKAILAKLPQDSECREQLRAQIKDALSTIDLCGEVKPNGTTIERRRRRVTRSIVMQKQVQVMQDPPSTPGPKQQTIQVPTPTTSSRKATQSRSPKVPIRQNNGSIIMVSEKRAKAIVTQVQPVSHAKAHPPLPGLLFRYWCRDPKDSMCGRDSEHGFWARKYFKCNVIPHMPPKSVDIDPVDVFNHMNRNMEKSPFISTASRLIWVIQLLIKQLNAGDKDGKVTVIDASRLFWRTVYHARPFHDEIQKTYAFGNGAWRYAGTHEYLVWKEIPRPAILHTFKATDLIDIVASMEIRNALRLDVLKMLAISLTNKLKMLKEDHVTLTPVLVGSLAQLCIFFGLDAHSAIEHISHIVADVIEGWGLQVEYRGGSEWHRIATVFAKNLCKRSAQPVEFKERERSKLAFLIGVRWGCGKCQAAHSAVEVAQMERKARLIGLEDPFRIITDQMDAVKHLAISYQNTEARRLRNYHEQPLLCEREDVTMTMDEEDQENQFGGGLMARQTPVGFGGDQIVYSAEDDDDFLL